MLKKQKAKEETETEVEEADVVMVEVTEKDVVQGAEIEEDVMIVGLKVTGVLVVLETEKTEEDRIIHLGQDDQSPFLNPEDQTGQGVRDVKLFC